MPAPVVGRPARRVAGSFPPPSARPHLARLESLGQRGIKLGLAAIDAVCGRLGRPERRVPPVLVAPVPPAPPVALTTEPKLEVEPVEPSLAPAAPPTPAKPTETATVAPSAEAAMMLSA